MTYSD